jgi:putative ABC transport system ATP-binding protein
MSVQDEKRLGTEESSMHRTTTPDEDQNPVQAPTTAPDPDLTSSAPAGSAPMFDLIDVAKTYQQSKRVVRALDGVSLSIPAGQLVAIQGPTGGGKSTLLQMLGALDRPTSGTVTLAGREISRLRDRQLAAIRAREIGFVFQSFNLIPTLTAQENVEMGLAPLGLPAKERAERATQALASVGLGERAAHLPGELSGGQQQRVAIARALAKRPKVLLADEPTGNLDEGTRDEIMDLFETLWRQGLTIVLVTHDSSVARRAERRLRIAGGTLTEKD